MLYPHETADAGGERPELTGTLMPGQRARPGSVGILRACDLDIARPQVRVLPGALRRRSRAYRKARRKID
ncbi:MAG: hypothetical protein M3332_01090, partial [Actinomycetota bacterium]|nr:hypothetical protein [Actinomycetota bacterium]